MRRAMIAAALALGWMTGATQGTAQTCVGDCDGSDSVTVNELVLGVNLLLGTATSTCDAFDADDDGAVEVNELVAAVGNTLAGCGRIPATRENVVENYADIVFANYSDAVALAEDLLESVEAFVDDPSADTLQAAKQAWLDSRPTYLQTEMTRFYDGPIDNEATGPEGLINAWPLDESFIDYVEGDADAGLINMPDEFPDIDAETLAALNESISETSIFTGYHAIEFLLWGQDLSASGPGARPFTDYVTDGSGTAANQERRGEYLIAVAELLVENLEAVRDAWDPALAGNYRAAFLAEDVDEALRRVLTGMGTLSGGELTGERLSVAFDTKDQEDEHSCFSDNTHVDHLYDAVGIANAYLGRYSSVRGNSVSGPSIYDLVRVEDQTLADQTEAAVTAAQEAIEAIPRPLDQAIQGADDSPGRVAIQAAIDALNRQTDGIADSAAALGISISTTLP